MRAARQWLGRGLSMVGVALVVRSGVALGDVSVLFGNLLVLGSALSWAYYTVQGRRVTESHPPVVAATASIGAGLVLLAPFAAAELALIGPPRPSVGSLAIILYLGVVATAVPFFLWNSAVWMLGAARCGPLTNLVSVVGLGLSVAAGAVRGLPTTRCIGRRGRSHPEHASPPRPVVGAAAARHEHSLPLTAEQNGRAMDDIDSLAGRIEAIALGPGSAHERAKRAANLIADRSGARWVGIYTIQADEVRNQAWSGPGPPAHPVFRTDQGRAHCGGLPDRPRGRQQRRQSRPALPRQIRTTPARN